MDISPNPSDMQEKKRHKKNKSRTQHLDTSSSQSDSSLSVSPLLPDNTVKNDDLSDASQISEHLSVNSSDSVENDCSYQEIEISNIPSPLDLNDNSTDDEDSNVENVLDLGGASQLHVQSIVDKILQSSAFKSDPEQVSLDSSESFNLFEGVNLNDSLINVTRGLESNRSNVKSDDVVLFNTENDRLREPEVLLSGKDDANAALTVELESFRELTSSNQSTLSLNTSTTDYKLYQEEFQNRIIEYQNALAHRDCIIQQLTEVLQESVINREQLQDQSERFSKEIVELKGQLAETSTIINEFKLNMPANVYNKIDCDTQTSQLVPDTTEKTSVCESNGGFDEQCSLLEETLNLSQIELLNKLRKCINLHLERKMCEYKSAHRNELKIMEDKLENEKVEYETEILKLRDLLSTLQCDQADIVAVRQNLEAKHAQELEELRTYFEKKCADLEKQYSEEVFSQQSRKLSGSSSSLETSDFMCSGSLPIHGPGGDNELACRNDSNIPQINYSNITKDDLLKLKTILSKITHDLDKYKIENISKQELQQLKTELEKHNLAFLLKFDIVSLRNELQNKYNAELEILREDYENRIDTLTVQNNNQVESLEKKYVEQINSLKGDLEDALHNQGDQEVASSGEFEPADVVESYELRLQEQVTLAKIDIINALEHQIQMLVSNTAEDAEWPTELLQLRSRFTQKYEKEIGELEEKHQQEVDKLKSELLNNNNNDLVKERDDLKRTTHILRHLLTELMKFFTECENELNNTLVEELLKQGFDKNLTNLESELNLNESSNSTSSDTATQSKKRVHFTPKFDDILATIDSSVSSSLDSNISLDLKNELGACLKRLRSDANEVLALSTTLNKTDQVPLEDLTILQDKVSSLTNQLLIEGQVKKDLTDQLNEVSAYLKNLEVDRANSETYIEELLAKQKILEMDLENAQIKMTQLIENSHKEVISVGYGNNRTTDNKTPTLSELQERVKSGALEFGITMEHPFFQLVDEFCRQGDRIGEEAKYNHEDLQQQIEAADKKLRATSQFLEEQAAEREQERDDAQKEIALLKDQLREREKDHVNCDLVYHEVEQLEQKMRQMSSSLEKNDKRLNEVESEKKEAIEKIFFLRDIIRGLENELEIKVETETKLRDSISQLKDIIQQQNKLNEELGQRLGLLSSTSEVHQYQEHIDQLENEVERLRINKEFVGSEGALKQIKTQLNEFEMSIDKCTRELEVLHSSVCTTACSSPSEDVSIRDQINTRSPNISDDCDVPLQQLARLKEKLIKHSRAEDAAVKRIRDLEMELGTFRHDLNDIQNERDVLQDQVSEQLVLIASLQMRLDDQRLRAEHIRKQTNTSLEARIYDLENEVKDLMDIINSKDKMIKQLNKVVDETQVKLQQQEQQINSNEDQKIIEKLQTENASLLAKINNDAQNAQVLPNLVDNILADKNKDIQMLRTKLEKTETELNFFHSLNFDNEQLKVLSRLQNSDRAFSDILSLIDVDTRKANKTCDSLNTSFDLPHFKRMQNETSLAVPEISSIEKIGDQKNIHYSMEAPLTKPNSTEIKSAEKKKVHFEDSNEIFELKKELRKKEELIVDYAERLETLRRLETVIDELQHKLDNTEKALDTVTTTFEKEQLMLKELRVELAEKNMHLIDKEQQLESYIQDASRKDQMYILLAKEKRQLEIGLENQNANIEKIKVLEQNLSEKQSDLEKLTNKLEALEGVDSQLAQHNEINAKLTKDIRNLESQCDLLTKEIGVLKQVINDKDNELEQLQTKLQAQITYEDKISEMKNVIVDRDTEIEILNEDAVHYQDDLAKLENKIKALTTSVNNEFEIKLAQSGRDIAARNLQIEKLKSELSDCKHELEYQSGIINDKDNVIKQMTLDSKSLHTNLETIQAKLQETGNIINLKDRLEQEQRLNKQLQEELAHLRSEIESHNKPMDMTTSIDEITGAVRKQLDYSAHLDSNILNAVGVCDLEELLEQEKAKNTHLQEILTKQQLEDSEMLEQLRLRLEDALKKEVQFSKLLQQEKQAYNILQQQLKDISNKSSPVQFRSLPNNLNMKEFVRLTKEVQTLLEENSRLKDEIRKLKSAKVESSANLKYSKDMLQLRDEKITKLEKQVKEIRISEASIKQALIECKIDLEQRSCEIENSRILIEELEQEGREMKKEVSHLRERLQKTTENTNSLKNNPMKLPVPDEFVNRMKELTDLSNSLMQDNKKLTKFIKKLSDEKRLLQQRIFELQENSNVDLTADDLSAKVNHLFARYLRSESYRKALVFQKKYLIELLGSYQAHPSLPKELTLQPPFKKQRLVSFKIVTVSIIAIIRMQYLVQRWNSGKRGYRQQLRLNIPRHSGGFHIGLPVSNQNFSCNPRIDPSTIINNPSTNFPQTNSHADVSDENDDTLRPATPPSPSMAPWSGATPPTKESGIKLGVANIKQRQSDTRLHSSDVTLQAPRPLSHYANKFDEIAQRLGTTMEKYS